MLTGDGVPPTTAQSCVLSQDDQGLWTLTPSPRVVRVIDIEWEGEHYIPVSDRKRGCANCAFDGILCAPIPCAGIVWMERSAALKARIKGKL